MSDHRNRTPDLIPQGLSQYIFKPVRAVVLGALNEAKMYYEKRQKFCVTFFFYLANNKQQLSKDLEIVENSENIS